MGSDEEGIPLNKDAEGTALNKDEEGIPLYKPERQGGEWVGHLKSDGRQGRVVRFGLNSGCDSPLPAIREYSGRSCNGQDRSHPPQMPPSPHNQAHGCECSCNICSVCGVHAFLERRGTVDRKSTRLNSS